LMSTGRSNDSAEPPSEPEAPFTGNQRPSWLARHGRHPVTWAVVGLVLLGCAGVALLQQQQPGARARAQTIYCGLVTCAVLRSVSETSTAAAPTPHPSSAALPSSVAPAPTPAPTQARSPSPKPVATSEPAPAPAPKPTPTPTPKPSPTRTPGPPRLPWPPTWPPHGPLGGGGGWHSPPGYGYRPPGGYQQHRW
jgi:hypothetical protein